MGSTPRVAAPVTKIDEKLVGDLVATDRQVTLTHAESIQIVLSLRNRAVLLRHDPYYIALMPSEVRSAQIEHCESAIEKLKA